MARPAPNMWAPHGHPVYVRACVEASLRRLGTERLDLCYLHRIDPEVPLADQLGTLSALRDEGKIGHIGLSKDEGTVARAHGVFAALNWRLQLGDVVAPIPSTSQPQHLEEVVSAAAAGGWS